MKNFILKTSKPILLFILFFTSFAIAQTTHIVNNNTGTDADFTDLQAAIDAAANGDIIHIQQSSTSYGNITLDKELTLIGRSHSDASYTSQVGTINLADGCSKSTIKGLRTGTITEPFVSGATHIIEDLVLQDNRISNISNLGIYGTFNNMLIQGNLIESGIAIGQKTSNLLITNNLINGSSVSLSSVSTLLFTNNVLSYWNGVSISNNSSDLLNISNCIFIMERTVDRTINLSTSSGTIQVTNCVTYNYNSPNNYTFVTGANITLTNNQENIDPLFVDRGGLGDSTFNPEQYDLSLQAASTVIDNGLYQNYNFKEVGTPTGLPSIKIDTYSPTVPKNSDITVTVSAKTN